MQHFSDMPFVFFNSHVQTFNDYEVQPPIIWFNFPPNSGYQTTAGLCSCPALDRATMCLHSEVPLVLFSSKIEVDSSLFVHACVSGIVLSLERVGDWAVKGLAGWRERERER